MSRGTKIKRTIELNGKLYDARTGRLVNDEQASKPRTLAKNTVDDVIKPIKPQAAKKPVVPRSESKTKPKPQKSRTLMRSAVKKPQALAQPHEAAAKQVHFKKANPRRKIRAHATPKSDLVRRFNPGAPVSIIKKEAVLPVAQKPTVSQHITNEVARLATSAETQVKHSVDIIEESLRNATSHLEKFEDKVSRSTFWDRVGFRNKTANLASLTVAGLLLLGFFAYQNVPNAEMRLAATRSGVSASIPDYRPAGFSGAQDIKSEPGKVSVSFFSNSSDKHFTVTQQASNWSSDSLLTNHVLASKQPFQTFQDAGKTIYIYNDSSATWVNGGVWYQVDGDASLTSDQLLRIANSF